MENLEENILDIIDSDSLITILLNNKEGILSSSLTNIETNEEINKLKLDDFKNELLEKNNIIEKIIRLFIYYIKRNDFIFNSKNEELINYQNKLEKTIIKLNHYKRLAQSNYEEIQNLYKKINYLNEETEINESKLIKCENQIQNYLTQIQNYERSISINKKIKFIDEDKQNLEELLQNNYEIIKKSFPNYFCKCLGKYDILREHFWIIKKHYSDIKKKELDLLNINEELLNRSSSLEIENKKIFNQLQVAHKKIKSYQEKTTHLLLKKTNPSINFKKNAIIKSLPNIENQKDENLYLNYSPYNKKKKNNDKSIIPSINLNSNINIEEEDQEKNKISSLLYDINKSYDNQENLFEHEIFSMTDKIKMIEVFDEMEINSPIMKKNKSIEINDDQYNEEQLTKNSIEKMEEINLLKMKKYNYGDKYSTFNIVVILMLIPISITHKIIRFSKVFNRKK